MPHREAEKIIFNRRSDRLKKGETIEWLSLQTIINMWSMSARSKL